MRPGWAAWVSWRRVAIVGLSIAASTGCETLELSTQTTGSPRSVGCFHFTGDGMYEGFERWLASLTAEERAIIDELTARKDVRIHIILKVGFLNEIESRGGAATLASTPLAKNACFWHPKAQGVPPERDWDVIYDRQMAEEFERRHGIPTPVEVILHHEIFGHILVLLSHPELLDPFAIDTDLEKMTEPGALEMENQYRIRRGLRTVSPRLVGISPR